MRKRQLRLVLATGAAFALSAGAGAVALSAPTGTTTYPTTVKFVTGAGTQTEDTVMGQLNTDSKCRRLRKVTISRQTGSGYTQVDKVLSSARGAWAFHVGVDPSTSIRFKFTAPRDIRENGSVVCEADTYTRTLGGANTRAGTAASSAVAARGTTSYRTDIQWRVYGPGSPYAHTAGVLDTNPRCLGLRKVRMYKMTSSGYKRMDTILSSANGAWGFLYESDSPSLTRVRFTVTEVLRDHDTVVCRGSTQDETFD